MSMCPTRAPSVPGLPRSQGQGQWQRARDTADQSVSDAVVDRRDQPRNGI
jgi:hypothetical protein